MLPTSDAESTASAPHRQPIHRSDRARWASVCCRAATAAGLVCRRSPSAIAKVTNKRVQPRSCASNSALPVELACKRLSVLQAGSEAHLRDCCRRKLLQISPASHSRSAPTSSVVGVEGRVCTPPGSPASPAALRRRVGQSMLLTGTNATSPLLCATLQGQQAQRSAAQQQAPRTPNQSGSRVSTAVPY